MASSSTGSGITLFTLAAIVTAVLATLKITDKADFSWWVVFAPLLIWLGLVLIILAFVAIIVYVATRD